jgi:hypothetical protein
VPGPEELDQPLEDALRHADLDELLRLVDQRCASGDWDGLATLRERSARAHETGRQLWPAAAHAAYRLALEAPPGHAARVLVEGMGRFALGPLPEVAAQHHTWRELAPHAPAGAPAVLAAHERVVRGEDCTGVAPTGPPVLELPLQLEEWEPTYALATYRSHTADFPTPPLPSFEPLDLPEAPPDHPLDDAAHALLDLVRAWTSGSDGRAVASVVEGDARAAIAALGPSRVRAAELAPADAVAWMAWAGASGGAHAGRPGAAAGRFGAWWAIATLAGMADDWPPAPGMLGKAVEEVRWFAWQADEPATGWRVQLAVEHPRTRRAWALSAVDAR